MGDLLGKLLEEVLVKPGLCGSLHPSSVINSMYFEKEKGCNSGTLDKFVHWPLSIIIAF